MPLANIPKRCGVRDGVDREEMRAWMGLPPKEAGKEFEKFAVDGHSGLRESWVPTAVFTQQTP